MEFLPRIGLQASIEWTVDQAATADAFGNPGVFVLATPMVLDMMEIACARALAEVLPKDWVTLGTRADFRHLKATPQGMKVKAHATLTEVDRQRLVFQVAVFDEIEQIAQGIHERFALPVSRFERMIEEKKTRWREGLSAT